MVCYILCSSCTDLLDNNKDICILFHKDSDLVEWTRLYLYYMCIEWAVTTVTFDALCESHHPVDSVGCDYYNHNHS